MSIPKKKKRYSLAIEKPEEDFKSYMIEKPIYKLPTELSSVKDIKVDPLEIKREWTTGDWIGFGGLSLTTLGLIYSLLNPGRDIEKEQEEWRRGNSAFNHAIASIPRIQTEYDPITLNSFLPKTERRNMYDNIISNM